MILSPASCFCPGSALGRHLMGSDEEQVGQSNSARSSIRRRGVTCGLTRSIVPATGPCSRRLVSRTARTCTLLVARRLGRGRVVAGDPPDAYGNSLRNAL